MTMPTAPPATPSLFATEILPFVLSFGALIAATALVDLGLHALGLVWVGRYLGVPGVALIVVSMAYSLRKRKWVTVGSPKGLLRAHELLAWGGSLLVTVHAGVHFNAVLPWLALVAMLTNVASGLVGRFLLDRSRRHLAAARERHRQTGSTEEETERALFWDAVTTTWMAQWRAVHLPISVAFAVLSLGHVLSVFALWGWR